MRFLGLASECWAVWLGARGLEFGVWIAREMGWKGSGGRGKYVSGVYTGGGEIGIGKSTMSPYIERHIYIYTYNRIFSRDQLKAVNNDTYVRVENY